MSRAALAPAVRPHRSAHLTTLSLGLALLGGLTAFAIALPPLLSDPAFQNYEAVLQPPSWAHPFGTDLLGRDLLSRLAQGARISLIAAFGSQALALTIGTLVGGIAAQAGGRLDGLLMRLTDAVFAFPALLLIVLLQARRAGRSGDAHARHRADHLAPVRAPGARTAPRLFAG